jgi:FMN-binding domain
MPKRGAVALGLTALALVLLLNFQVPTDTVTVGRQPGVSGPVATIPGSPTGGGASSGGTGGSGGSTDNASGKSQVTGPVVDTRFGPVQVAVTVDAGKIVDISAVELPVGGRSGQISTYAEPILHTQALQAQSANIDGVSGATYTSIAYARSLQAALDSAGI